MKSILKKLLLTSAVLFLTSTCMANSTFNARYVTYQNNQWVMVGDTTASDELGIAINKDDGHGWNFPKVTNPLGTIVGLHKVTYGGHLWVATGNSSTFFISKDNGTTWIEQSFPAFEGYYPRSIDAVSYGNGTWVALGKSSTASSLITVAYTSTDGTTWTPHALPDNATGAWLNDVTFGGNQFVAVGNSGNIYSSQDGITWSASTLPAAANGAAVTLSSVNYNGIVWLAVGIISGTNTAVAYQSIDGQTWQVVNLPAAIHFLPAETIYANGQWMIVGRDVDQGLEYLTVLTSQDIISNWIGYTITSQAPAPKSGGVELNGVAFGNGKWLGIGPSGDESSSIVYTSVNNGSDWTAANVFSTSHK